MAKPIVTPEERFMSRVEPEPNSGCWLWTGPSNSKGYGKTTHGFMPSGAGRIVLAHRMAWILRFGSIPDGLCVLHRCDNPPCVNPSHLFLGTSDDNNKDRSIKGRSRDQRGERHNMAKLTAEDVRAIRSIEGISHTTIAEKYGLSQAHVSKIKRGESWEHLVPVSTTEEGKSKQ